MKKHFDDTIFFSENPLKYAYHLCINCLWSSLLFVVVFVVSQAHSDDNDTIR